MQPLDVAALTLRRQSFATFTPQRLRETRGAFLFSFLSGSLRGGYSQDTSYPPKGQAEPTCSVFNEKKIRRDRCLRASKHCLRLASLPSSQPVQKNQLKSSWSLTQSQSQLSQLTPANTNNSNRGQLPAASGSFAIGEARSVQRISTPFDILAVEPHLAFNRSTLNEGGPEQCNASLQAYPRWSLLRPVLRNQNRSLSGVNQPTTNSATTNAMSFREQTLVSRRTTKSRVCCQMGRQPLRATSARQMADAIRVTTTARPLVGAVRPAHREHPDDHNATCDLTLRAHAARSALSSMKVEGLA